MLRAFHVAKTDDLKPGKIVSEWNSMPDRKAKESFKVVKLVHYSKKNELGEYQVRPVSVSNDPGNLTDRNGRPSRDLR